MAFEVVEDHISIYGLLTQHGLSQPGSVWKHLLLKHKDELPPFTYKQFTMRDGRKGRLRPALRVEHQQEFERLLHQWFPVGHGLSLQEKAFLHLLEEMFPDLEPEWQVEVHGVTFDLFFHQAQLGVVLSSHFVQDTASLQLHGVQVLVFDPNTLDFSPGRAAFQIRQALQNPGLSSNP